MMTVPMGNSSAPSARELVQHLYNKNIELENGLRMAAQSKIPSDPNTWLQMRENYEAILLEDHDFSEKHEIEYKLWQLHYRRIEEFRAHINATPASTVSVTAHGGKGAARPDRIRRIRNAFKSFLSEATGFYHDLILKIRAKYGLPLGYFSDGPENQITLAKDGKKSAETKKGLLSCHRCLIYLGDLARYKGLYGEGDSVARDYAAASSYYIQAASLWPSSGNPHHQLAILASYSGDDLVAVYRYFRSLAVDSPFSTARDNLIIAFEKNRQIYSQLSGDAKMLSVKTTPVRMTGKGRGLRGETRLLAKDIKTEVTPVEENVTSMLDTYKAFCTRFVRLNGILFTRTSLETFGEIFSSVTSDLQELLSSGPEEELNFGSDTAENGLFVVRLITVLIFTVHNVNRESEGQSYAEILQRSVLLQNAFTAAFEFVGHIVKRCLQLKDILSSYLLPSILVFIEWLACHPDVAGRDVEDKQAAAQCFFWNHCVILLNKLISSGFVSIDGDEDETCFVDMSRYDEGETDNRLALWEDFELRGFSPLVPAQLILDFSRKHSFGNNGSSKEKKARVQRILAAGRALMNIVRIDQQGIYFDQKLKRYSIGVEPVDNMLPTSLDLSKPNGGVPHEKAKNLGVLQSNAQLYVEGEEEDEVIVFKPTIAEKHTDVSAPSLNSYEVLGPIMDSSKDDWASFAGGSPISNPLVQAATSNGISNAPTSVTSIIPQQLHYVNPATSMWVTEQQGILDNGMKNLSISGNGFVAKAGLQERLGVSEAPGFPQPFPFVTNFAASGMPGIGVAEAMVPSKLDSVIPSGVGNDGLLKNSTGSPISSRRNPVGRPVRHFGPPPGFSPIPSKQMNDFMSGRVLNNGHPPIDDYSWLDGYQSGSNESLGLNNSLNQTGIMHPHFAGNSNGVTGGLMSNFPFPGKQVSTVQSRMENQQIQPDHQLLEQLKLYKEQQQQHIQRGNQQAPLPEQFQGQSLWSGRFFV